MLLALSFFESISSASIYKELNFKSINQDYSHTVLGEVFINSTEGPSKYLHQALKEVYAAEFYPFYYIIYLIDKNNHSYERSSELNVTKTPTIIFDGGYAKSSSVFNNTELWTAKINGIVNACGARDVKDINLSLDVEWLGAVNPFPPNGSTDVPTETYLSCSISEMKIDVEATNNETSEYNCHIHVQVTEVESEWWNDKFGNPYTFEFKDYAYNDDVQIGAGDTWNETIFWDGCDYNDGDDPPRYFDHIIQDNIMIIAAAMDNDLNKWVDETAGFRAGINTDPKRFDFYFGDTYPPPLFEFNTTYYWKIVAWDPYGLNSTGGIWNFRTEPNYPPNPANEPRPPNGVKNVPGNVILRWNGSDPNLCDTLYYDVYFGPNPNPPKVKTKISQNCYDPYDELPIFEDIYWRIDTWDKGGGLMTIGEEWTFTTGLNPPPKDPEINGPNRGSPNTVYDFTFLSFDPDNQTIQYIVDWGDGSEIVETDFYDNGTMITLNHSWDKKGEYIIKTRVIDEYGETSDWSTHKINIPRNRASYYSLIQWFLQKFPVLFRFLSYIK